MKLKRIKLISSLFLIMSVSLAGCSFSKSADEAVKSGAYAAGNETSVSDADLSFAVLGDVHDNTDNFQATVDELYSINPKMDALVLNGDTVDQGIDEQYDAMKKAIEKNAKKMPDTIIKNIGNHEFYNYNMDTNSDEDIKNFTDKYLDFAGTEKVYHDTWINDYHFISLGSDNLSSEDLNTTQASLSKTQLSWLKEKLAENYVKGKPIFVFLHQPLSTDFFGRQWYGIRQGDELKVILERYPEVIIFSSHTHKEFGDDTIQKNMPFTMVYTGAVGYTLIKDSSSDNGRKRDNSINNAVYVEVKDDVVTLKERDIENHKWVSSEELNEKADQ